MEIEITIYTSGSMSNPESCDHNAWVLVLQ